VPARRRPSPDPRVLLARLVDRLSERSQFVTLAEIEQAASRPSSRLATHDLAALVDGAVADSLLLKDLRTFYDRQSGAFADRWVYRVNVRHPLVATLLADDHP
jgi:hypothetical protein